MEWYGHISELKEQLNTNFNPEHHLHPLNPSFHIVTELIQPITKSYTNSLVLKSIAYETINTLYPEDDWLRIYTDGSRIEDCINSGAGVYSRLFAFFSPVGRFRTAFDGEIEAIQIALSQLLCHLNHFTRVVILSDSKAALQAINSTRVPTSVAIWNCQSLLRCLSDNHKTIFLQWIPAHCGVEGNERADLLAKKGAAILQTANENVPFHNARLFVRSVFKTNLKRDLSARSSQRSWWKDVQKIPDYPRMKAVAEFRLATGHDCLARHLHHINILNSPNCMLCNLQQPMDSDHLRRCPALCSKSMWERYWEARDRMGP